MAKKATKKYFYDMYVDSKGKYGIKNLSDKDLTSRASKAITPMYTTLLTQLGTGNTENKSALNAENAGVGNAYATSEAAVNQAAGEANTQQAADAANRGITVDTANMANVTGKAQATAIKDLGASRQQELDTINRNADLLYGQYQDAMKNLDVEKAGAIYKQYAAEKDKGQKLFMTLQQMNYAKTHKGGGGGGGGRGGYTYSDLLTMMLAAQQEAQRKAYERASKAVASDRKDMSTNPMFPDIYTASKK